MNRREKICSLRKEIVADIREYVRSQREDWRRVPWLALQADGRNGCYSEEYAYAYRRGLWLVQGMGRTPAVDCATGELGGIAIRCVITALSDHDTLALASSLDKLSAAAIMRGLQARASGRAGSGGMQADPDQRAGWREELIAELKLGRSYIRHPRPAIAA